mmetsp:Transcript_20439/g.81749  ORF Transcript_20439/g.81749 Transcript_20439/m.81749 type:complete len:222 (-) Transcript_20439:1034-1699(-)
MSLAIALGAALCTVSFLLVHHPCALDEKKGARTTIKTTKRGRRPVCLSTPRETWRLVKLGLLPPVLFLTLLVEEPRRVAAPVERGAREAVDAASMEVVVSRRRGADDERGEREEDRDAEVVAKEGRAPTWPVGVVSKVRVAGLSSLVAIRLEQARLEAAPVGRRERERGEVREIVRRRGDGRELPVDDAHAALAVDEEVVGAVVAVDEDGAQARRGPSESV